MAVRWSGGVEMMSGIAYRLYESKDRGDIRRISCDTADAGKPIDRIFEDRELVADILTAYYTEFEPESAWVAEDAGTVVGYVTGCMNSWRYAAMMALVVLPMAAVKALARGTMFRAETWRALKSLSGTPSGGGLQRVRLFRSYPAHLHVNVEERYQRRGIGRELVMRFLEAARAKGASGVHAGVRGDNAAGRRFFEGLGFTEVMGHPMFHVGMGSGGILWEIVYGKRL